KLLTIHFYKAFSSGDKIIGGYECQPHSQPWQAYLSDNRIACGGSLINEIYNFTFLIISTLEYFSLKCICTFMSCLSNRQQRIRVEKIIPYPKYNDQPHNNDILLIKLRKPATFNEYVKPVPLATKCSSAGEKCLVSGWGRTEAGSASVLQCLDMPVLSKERCKSAYGTIITKNMFCAGFMEGGKDSCQGDSGGPVVCSGKLKGVVSFGKGCAEPDFPGVYVEVCRYTSWIKSIIANN
uniref:trypsin n=1 Tax=Sinocyclocheilus rhinocerous TaxID=307959 RepID=A0A673LH93_9TELE